MVINHYVFKKEIQLENHDIQQSILPDWLFDETNLFKNNNRQKKIQFLEQYQICDRVFKETKIPGPLFWTAKNGVQ